jgi:hypothetical protein
MVLDAPPAPTLPELLWPSDGGSGDDWGGHDGGEGGGGWWSEDPDEWEANGDAPYQHSRARRALTLLTVLMLALASVGGFLLLLIGGATGAPLSSHVVSVEPVPASQQSPAAEEVAFTVTNTAKISAGARCVVSVFGGDNELGSTTVVAQVPLAVGITERASALVSLPHSTGATSATVACEQASVVVSK